MKVNNTHDYLCWLQEAIQDIRCLQYYIEQEDDLHIMSSLFELQLRLDSAPKNVSWAADHPLVAVLCDVMNWASVHKHDQNSLPAILQTISDHHFNMSVSETR